MQILKTDVSTRFETGISYFYKVSFFGEAGQSIVVDFASDELIESDDLAEEQALRVMADTAGISLNDGPFQMEERVVGVASVAPLDEDDPYQESDEALPDDLEEKVISQNPSRVGGRFDEI
jgi:hypothetical protein